MSLRMPVFALTAFHVLASLVTSEASQPRTFKVPLGRQDVPVMVNGRQVANKTAYFGTVFVGLPHPQEFTVVFDTGSGHLFLPSSSCNDEPCRLHKTYARAESQSAVEINHDGSRVKNPHTAVRDQVGISYGAGEIVGDFVQETVCLAAPAPESLPIESYTESQAIAVLAPHCTRVRVITALEMAKEPFSHFAFDGVLGLGLDSLAVDPDFHFFGKMTRDMQIEPIFSFFISKSGNVASEITFGGSDIDRFKGPMHWVPVHDPELGHWSVQVKGIRVGDESLPFCDDGSCTAIVDTGTSLLGVPSAGLDSIMWKTAQEVPKDSAIDCRSWPGPSLIFELAGGLEVELAPEDYSRPVPSQVPSTDGNETLLVCRANLLPVDLPSLGAKVFIWGAPVLQKYYTSYDTRSETPRVGFAPALHPEENAAVDYLAVDPVVV